MRYILIPCPPNLPESWNTTSNTCTRHVLACQTDAERKSVIDSYGSKWTSLKDWLAKFSNTKCWYCEAITNRSPNDVDHFRPKKGITIEGQELTNHSGYYWLTYEWSNYRLSCQRCNRPENEGQQKLGKRNEFPIRDETTRCKGPEHLHSREEPKLLDPCVESDCALLIHAIDGEVKESADSNTWEYERATYTIKTYGLNAWGVPEVKRSHWQTLASIISMATQLNVTTEAELEIQKHIDEAHEYSSFFRSAIGTHRDKDWINAML